MKKAIALTVLSLLMAALLPALAGAAMKECFSVTGSDWKICGENKQGLVLKLKNMCVETMQLQLCLEKDGGEWDCRWFREVEKEAELEMESCGNTGNYKIISCEDLDDCNRKSMKN